MTATTTGGNPATATTGGPAPQLDGVARPIPEGWQLRVVSYGLSCPLASAEAVGRRFRGSVIGRRFRGNRARVVKATLPRPMRRPATLGR